MEETHPVIRYCDPVLTDNEYQLQDKVDHVQSISRRLTLQVHPDKL